MKYDVAIEQAQLRRSEALRELTRWVMKNVRRANARIADLLQARGRSRSKLRDGPRAYRRALLQPEGSGNVKPYIQKAYDLRDRVSRRERLYIAEKYYNYITGELDKAGETLQAWSKLYPDDFVPHNNLSINYRTLGRNEEALKESLEAVRLGRTMLLREQT